MGIQYPHFCLTKTMMNIRLTINEQQFKQGLEIALNRFLKENYTLEEFIAIVLEDAKRLKPDVSIPTFNYEYDIAEELGYFKMFMSVKKRRSLTDSEAWHFMEDVLKDFGMKPRFENYVDMYAAKSRYVTSLNF